MGFERNVLDSYLWKCLTPIGDDLRKYWTPLGDVFGKFGLHLEMFWKLWTPTGDV